MKLFRLFLILFVLGLPVFSHGATQQQCVTYGENLNFSFDQLSDAVTKVGSSAASIVLRYGTWNLSANVSTNANTHFQIPPGAVLDGAYTLTINGPFSGSKGCFGSSITVVFASGSVDEVHPKWWSETGASNVKTRAAIATSKIPMYFGKVTTDPTTTGWGDSESGSWWMNSTDNVWKYWDGSAIGSMSSAGSVIISETTAASTYVVLSESTSGSITARYSASLTYDAGTGILTALGFAGAFNGAIGGTTPAQGEFTNIYLQSADITHGVTSLLDADQYGGMFKIGAAGGLDVYGITESDQDGALRLTGIIGASNPTDTYFPIIVRGGKQNLTGWQKMGDSEALYGFYNYTTGVGFVYGDGSWHLTSIQNTPIGSVIAAAGTFTTLGATGSATMSYGLSVTMGNNSGGIIDIYEDSDNGASYFRIKAPDSLAAPVFFTLPTAAAGGDNYLINVDADGTMGYTAPSAFQGADADLSLWAAITPPTLAAGNSVIIGTSATVMDKLPITGNNKVVGTNGSGTLGVYDVSAIVLNPAPSTDAKYSGILMTATAGENLAAGEVVYCKNKAGVHACYKYDNDLATEKEYPPRFMATATISADASGVFLVKGTFRLDSWAMTTNQDEGKIVYGSATPGGITLTKPSASGSMVSILGFVIEENVILFQPTYSLTENP